MPPHTNRQPHDLTNDNPEQDDEMHHDFTTDMAAVTRRIRRLRRRAAAAVCALALVGAGVVATADDSPSTDHEDALLQGSTWS